MLMFPMLLFRRRQRWHTIRIPVAEGESIQDAIDVITDASYVRRYVVLLGPGTFTEQVTLKTYISLQGSGVGVTTISHDGAAATTVIVGNRSKISHLTINSVNGICVSDNNDAGMASAHWVVENCALNAAMDVLQNFQNCTDAVIRMSNCVCTTDWDGVFVKGKRSLLVLNNVSITRDANAETTSGLIIGNIAAFPSTDYATILGWDLTLITDHPSEAHSHTIVLAIKTNITLHRLTATGAHNSALGSSGVTAGTGGTIKLYDSTVQVTNEGAGTHYDLANQGEYFGVSNVTYDDSSGAITEM